MNQPLLALFLRNLSDALDGIIQRIAEQAADIDGIHEMQRLAIGHAGKADILPLAVDAFTCKNRIQYLISRLILSFIDLDLPLHSVQAVRLLLRAHFASQNRDLVL